ncbi:MAG: AAA family ATPase [Candidatus Helarchaeota archaeon]
MSEKKNIVIERIATPEGDVPKAEGVIEAFNIITSKVSELSKKLSESLRLLNGKELSELGADLVVIKEDLVEIKSQLENNIKNISELQTNYNKIDNWAKKVDSIISQVADGQIEINMGAIRDYGTDSIIEEIRKITQEFQDTIKNLIKSAPDSEESSNIEKIYKIVSPEDIKITLEMLGDYQSNKDLILSRGRLIKLPKQLYNFDSKILLYGPPGNGKTSTVYAIAKELSLNILELNLPLLLANNIKFQIESLDYIINLVKNNENIIPCILLIENVQLIFNSEISNMALLNFLNFLDKINLCNDKVLVICTTIDLDDLDQPLLSRFDQYCLFDYPNEVARSEILHRLLENINLDENLDINILVSNLTMDENMDGLSCKDLVKIVEGAYFKSINENKEYVSEDDIQFSFNNIVAQKSKFSPRLKKISKVQSTTDKIYSSSSDLEEIELKIEALNSQMLINKKMIKNALRLALSDNYNLISRLAKLFETEQRALDLSEIQKVAGINIETLKRTLNKNPYSILFPKIGKKYTISFTDDQYNEVITEFELNK